VAESFASLSLVAEYPSVAPGTLVPIDHRAPSFPSSFLDPANPATDLNPLSVQVTAPTSHVVPRGNGDELLGSVCFS